MVAGLAIEHGIDVVSGIMLAGGTPKHRPVIRFFACKKDLSQEPPETPLPEGVLAGPRR